MHFSNTYATLDSRLYHKQPPTALQHPKAGHFNPLVAKQIGWTDDPYLMRNWVEILAGEIVPDGFDSLAMVYAGHQFGHWAGQLGDGRGLLMAQVQDTEGKLMDLHLKGAGLTPYSRMGDGRAVLRSTIREYLGGHALTQLGIASSSALGFVTSSTPVHRERVEQGASLMRVADCHVRLGHFEWIANFAPDLLSEFTEYAIQTYYPEISPSAESLSTFVHSVITRTAKLIADWQLVGFAHGVMNTDNLSITGSTLDYGPFGMMERFNPMWINNHSDHSGRYTYQNQPAIGLWNLQVWTRHLAVLKGKTLFEHAITDDAQALMTLFDEHLADYETVFIEHYHRGICQKLGLPWQDGNMTFNNASLNLAFEFLDILQQNKLDYTNSFRALLAVVANGFKIDTAIIKLKQTDLSHENELLNTLCNELGEDARQLFDQWQESYISHIANYGHNIKYPSASNDEARNQKDYHHTFIQTVMIMLASSNPVYVLRGQMAQVAIEQGEAGDFAEVDRLFRLLTDPFSVQSIAKLADTTPPTKDAPPLVISCSS